MGCYFLNVSEPINLLNEWTIAKEQYLTGGYILSLQGAKRLLNRFEGYFYSSDWMTSRLQEHSCCFTYYPWLIIQEGYDTTIGGNLQADHQKVIKCLNNIGY